jgi:glycosyltransferase involved in cell wall biosynthesis
MSRENAEPRSQPAVSVVLPTYQRRELVKRAVATVLTQTYRDFELIVIDDGSTDGTREALAPLVDRLTYRWQSNRGVAAARNAGLRLARGEIVAFLDSDDRWLPDHLAVVTEMLARHPEAVLATTCPKSVIGGRASLRKAKLYDPFPRTLLSNGAGFPSCVAIRREAIIAAGGFDERLAVSSDSDLFLRVALRGPFTMLQRRTTIRQYTTTGLMKSGQRGGLSIEAYKYRTRRAMEVLNRQSGSCGRDLSRPAHGAFAFACALDALDRGDYSAARRWLVKACQLFPDLSNQALVVHWRLGHLSRAHIPDAWMQYLDVTARLWPEPGAHTALFLRVSALTAAVGQVRPRLAAVQLAGWPLHATPRFVIRALPGLLTLARRRLDMRRHRSRDDVPVAGPALSEGRRSALGLILRGAEASDRRRALEALIGRR